MQEYDLHGRGTGLEPLNRFSSLHVEDDPGAREELARIDEGVCSHRPPTQVEEDQACSILTENRSPDIGFRYSLNPQPGCEHGCAYCYARPYHEFLGYNAGVDFETRILAKRKLPNCSLENWLPGPENPSPLPAAASPTATNPSSGNYTSPGNVSVFAQNSAIPSESSRRMPL